MHYDPKLISAIIGATASPKIGAIIGLASGIIFSGPGIIVNIAASAASRVSTWQKLLSASSFVGAISNSFSGGGDDDDEPIRVETRCPKNLRIQTPLCPGPWWARGVVGGLNDFMGGAGSALTFGFTDWFDDQRGINRGNRDSADYNAGWWAGTALTAAIPGGAAAKGAGYTVKAGRYAHGGGGINVLKDGVRKFAVDYHKFKSQGQWVKKIHFHWGKTASQMKKHRNIFGKPY
ncbi:MAG: hypothetical protein WKF34_07185 [Pyrinomonadaceae bacterium]